MIGEECHGRHTGCFHYLAYVSCRRIVRRTYVSGDLCCTICSVVLRVGRISTDFAESRSRPSGRLLKLGGSLKQSAPLGGRTHAQISRRRVSQSLSGQSSQSKRGTGIAIGPTGVKLSPAGDLITDFGMQSLRGLPFARFHCVCYNPSVALHAAGRFPP